MKYVSTILLICFAAAAAFAGGVKNGEDILTKMHDKYAGKWYKTLTFVQKTTNYKPDGTSTAETWYEAMTVPGSLRIDFADKPGDGILFTNGQIYQWRDGKGMPGRPFVHPLMVLGFDIYNQPAARTIEQVKAMGIDLTQVHEEKWQGRKVYVVGAAQGDLKKNQVWVDKDRLVFVRLIQMVGKDKDHVSETQFNKYEKFGGGWVSVDVRFFVDGKPTTTEEYSDVQVDIPLNADLWNPEKWLTVDTTYWKKK